MALYALADKKNTSVRALVRDYTYEERMGWIAYYALADEMAKDEAKKQGAGTGEQKTRGQIEYEKALAQMHASKHTGAKLGKL